MGYVTKVFVETSIEGAPQTGIFSNCERKYLKSPIFKCVHFHYNDIKNNQKILGYKLYYRERNPI